MPRRKSPSTVSRRMLEQRRRNQMNTLFTNLASVLQLRLQASMERMTVPTFLEHARAYVKTLKKRVKELKKKKENLQANQTMKLQESNILPIVVVTEMNSALEVNLIVGINRRFMLSEVLSVLEEEGADVLCVRYSTMGYKIVHTITCQAILARIGIDGSRVQERLTKVVFEG